MGRFKVFTWYLINAKFVEYPIVDEYKDNSKAILNELEVKDDDGCDDCEGDGDCEVEREEDENAIDEILVK